MNKEEYEWRLLNYLKGKATAEEKDELLDYFIRSYNELQPIVRQMRERIERLKTEPCMACIHKALPLD